MPKIKYTDSTYEVHRGETVLKALLRQGREIAFSCTKGTCTVCMHRCTSGSVPPESQRDLKPELVSKGYFLPCLCFPDGEMHVEPPRPEDLHFKARLVANVQLSPDVYKLLLEPEIDLSYRAGQFINVIRDSNTVRSYSLASVYGEEPYLEIHVQLVRGGAVSGWLQNELEIGDWLTLSGPFGQNFYRAAEPERDLVLIGTGTGLAPIYGIAKQAIYQDHVGDIHLYHAGSVGSDLYLHSELLRYEEEYRRFHYHPYTVAGSATANAINAIDDKTKISEIAFQEFSNICDARIHVAGQPVTIDRCTELAIQNNISRDMILADSFEHSNSDSSSVSEVGKEHEEDQCNVEIGPRKFSPDPEMWEALGNGKKLREILNDFYSRAFKDHILSPYFHGVTEQRVAEKVFSYLKQAFTGERQYFGNHPRNAHHWMVIDDDTFDYRERMMVECIRQHGLPEHLILRWSALEEQFRGDIVKPQPWGRIVDGVELPSAGYDDLLLEYSTVCDGCEQEIYAGTNVRYHLRLGSVYGECCNDNLDLEAVS